MKRLDSIPPPDSNIDLHKSVVSRKQEPCRGNLIAKESIISSKINQYERCANTSSLESITAAPRLGAVKNDLHSCFTGKTKNLKAIFKKIEDSQTPGLLKWCPYCGLTKPNSFDHYLPKESFPEFSITPLNLVSCCTTCNSSKGEKWLNKNAERLFLHFYADDIPETQFLFAETVNDGNAFAATYSLIQPDDCSDYTWETISSHFSELKLLHQFSENTNDEIVSIKNMCIAHFKAGGSYVEAYIRHLAKEEEKTFGANHWRIVLMRSLAQNNAFIEHVESEADSDES